MNKTTEKLDCWAVVELMGHQRIAGHITERTVAGAPMLQVNVPELGEVPAYTRLLGGGAIYAINLCDEATAIEWAKSIGGNAAPLVSWEGKQIVDVMVERRIKALNASAEPTEAGGDDDQDQEDDLPY
jgi:hypothetical protein